MLEKMPKSNKAVVISNCQCLPLASTLTRLSADTIFDHWGVHILPPDRRSTLIAEFVDRARVEYDFVVTIPLGKEFDALSSDVINNTFEIPVFTISNIYFSGYHPDLTYLGGFAKRIVGPLGDYHSKMCLYAFANGLCVDDALNLFSNETYAKVGYYDEFISSFETLKNRDIHVDIRVTDILPGILQDRFCFLSVNHPSLDLFVAYGDFIISYLKKRGLVRHSGLPADANLFKEGLAESVIFPIYREIAERHGVPRFGSYAFKPQGGSVNPIDLNAYIEAEYAVFSEVGVEPLVKSYNGSLVMKQFEMLEIVK